jgi:hypothetical protein
MTSRMKKVPELARVLPGVISIHEIYTLEEAKGRLGWSESAFRAAKRRGLSVVTSGKRRYLTGTAILNYLQGCHS